MNQDMRIQDPGRPAPAAVGRILLLASLSFFGADAGADGNRTDIAAQIRQQGQQALSAMQRDARRGVGDPGLWLARLCSTIATYRSSGDSVTAAGTAAPAERCAGPLGKTIIAKPGDRPGFILRSADGTPPP